MFLGALSMPIESTFSVEPEARGDVHYTHSLYREGASSDWSADANDFTMLNRLDGKNYRYRRKKRFSRLTRRQLLWLRK